MTKLEELASSLVDGYSKERGLEELKKYMTARYGPLIEIAKIVGSEKVYPFAPAKVREAVVRAEEE